MQVALIQMNARDDKPANLATAERLVRQAAAGGAQFIVLPELFSFIGRYDDYPAAAEPIPGPTTGRFAQLAAQLHVTLLAGSILEQPTHGPKLYNTSVLFDDKGRIAATYRKIHLFDVKGLGEESRVLAPGHKIVTATTPLGRIGLSICYDLRFPELYRALTSAGAAIICVPAAFTLTTGRHHWLPLLRARAIENLAYVLAPNQFGTHPPDQQCYGCSAVIDPWGETLAQAEQNHEAVLRAQLDPQRITQCRDQLPALAHRRTDLFPDPPALR